MEFCNPTPGHVSGENHRLKRYTHSFSEHHHYNIKIWKQPECPMTEEWRKKMLAYIYRRILSDIKQA